MCLVIALLPAIPLTFLVKTLLEKSFDVGLSTTVEDALQNGVVVSRMHLETLRAGFERDVLLAIEAGTDDKPDPVRIVEELSRGDSELNAYQVSVAKFERTAVFGQAIGDAPIRQRRGTGTRDDVLFFETRDRAYQLAVLTRFGRPALVLYHLTSPEFLEAADRLIEGGQIFAQLRLTQGMLSKSFFYPFITVYSVILVLSLGIALFMSQRLANPIQRLARGANIVSNRCPGTTGSSARWSPAVESVACPARYVPSCSRTMLF